MRHHAQHVAAFAANARDIVERSVGVGVGGDLTFGRGVAEDHAVLAPECIEGGRVAEVIAFHVTDGNLQHFAFLQVAGERRVGTFHPQMDLLADVLQSRVAQQGTGQQPGFAENLKSVADADHQPPGCGKLYDLAHDRGEFGDGPGEHVDTKGKPSGDTNGAPAFQYWYIKQYTSYRLLALV